MLKSWSSFLEFIDFANANCNWLVLRNFEFLPHNFFGNDKDIDILCDDISHFASTMGLVKRSWGISSYQALIKDTIVPVDIRFVKDNYYDPIWQYKMLENKIYDDSSVPRPDHKDYLFSFLYHLLFQKPFIADRYKERIICQYNLLFPDFSVSNFDYSILSNSLANYMRDCNYTYCRPHDVSVYQNSRNIELLPRDIIL